MIRFNKIVAVQNVYYSFVYMSKSFSLKPHCIPKRTFISKWISKESKSNVNRDPKDSEPRTVYGIDDPKFSTEYLKALRHPDFEKSYRNLSNELKLLYDETVTYYTENTNFRIDDRKGRIDMLFTFETEENLKKFNVTTDSSLFQGYSSASLKLSQAGTALFSGNICTDVPKDGNIGVSGFANFSNKPQRKSFYRVKFYDFSNYSHLVFKIRGDGRTYLVLLNIHGDYKEIEHCAYVHPLYTRGGPYWQIAKIPLSHFYFISKGAIQLNQNRIMNLNQIRKVGITVAGLDGPFQLEIDYIGLEYDELHKMICPYEAYR